MIAATYARDRDQTRLLIIDPQARATRFTRITDFPYSLQPGALLVMNDAATMPASLHGRTEAGQTVELRLLGPARGDLFDAILFGDGDYHTRTEDRLAPPDLSPGAWLRLDEQLRARVCGRAALSTRLVQLRFNLPGGELWRALYRLGRPIQYAYHPEPLALGSVQTLYAGRPWAAEMPSAGRPLSYATLVALKQRGVEWATLTHAAGLSSTGDMAIDRALPLPERYHIPVDTARAVARAHHEGRQIVAVGTSVVRALEAAALSGGSAFEATDTVTDLRIHAEHRLRVVSGLLTGVHSPEESHYDLLSAFLDRTLLDDSLRRANGLGFAGHEFGDACLILPGSLRAARPAA